ncbi:Gfo/Idh/MocA family protein [Shewanella basaltis]|uniref:Gfo/Idh/MocA family protein n=1 Tax=Shewanella basaltis TaxID=472183 RepID=UPI003AAD2CA4
MDRVAVIGLGNIANRHRKNLKTLFPNSQLYAMSASGRVPESTVSDADYIVNSIDDLLNKRVQLVIVASPAPFHVSHAIPLIEAGIPVLIEKPVATNTEDTTALLEAISQYSTPVAVGYCLRYLSSAREMKKLLELNVIGHLYHANVEIGQYLPDWRPGKNYQDSVSANASLGGGVLLELSHELDYTQWLLGELNLEYAILSKTEELSIEVEDSADILLSTQTRAVIHVHLDFLQRKAYRQCRFVGSKGVLEWDLIGNEIRFVSTQGIEILHCEPMWDKNQMYISMIEDFVAQINNHANRTVSVEESAKVVDIIEQIKLHSPVTTVLGDLKG